MARVAGVNIPDNKQAEVSLTYIFGIGKNRALDICEKVGVAPSTNIGDLKEKEIELIRVEVAKYVVEGDLRRETTTNIKRLMDLGYYRGIRHRRHQPVNGQRNRNNATSKIIKCCPIFIRRGESK